MRAFVHAYSARSVRAELPRAMTLSALNRPRTSKFLMLPRSVPAAYSLPDTTLRAIAGGKAGVTLGIARPVAARSTSVALAMRSESARARSSARLTSADRGRSTPACAPGIQLL